MKHIQKITYFFIVLVVILTVSCEKQNKIEKEISKIPVDLVIDRFDQKFSNLTIEKLPEIKKEYPFLFPAQYPDSIWIRKITDTIQKEINTEVAKVFQEFSKEEQELYSFFQHLKFYFPETKTPKIITVTSEVDYRNKVIIADSLLLVSLDVYLGEKHHFYEEIQGYLSKNFKRSQIVSDIALKYAERYAERPLKRTYLANMIYFGKLLYLNDLLLPEFSDARKIGYTQEEMEWAQINEEEIWRYFIDRQLLYSTDSDLSARFLFPAPFSKFQLELDDESPDRIGQYIGWRIVTSYMKKNSVSLSQLLITDEEKIFKASKYKPAR